MNDFNFFDLACNLAEDVYTGFKLPDSVSEKFSVSRMLVDRVTDPIDEQHVSLCVYSVSGKGKSTCAVNIARHASYLLAECKGREPEYYFNINHISDGNPKNTRRIIYECSKKENPIVIIDEGARDSNAREGMKKENVENVKLNAIIRHKRMIIIRCVQFEAFLDKGIRVQATHELTIVRANHHRGYNECKFKILVDKGSGTEDPWKVFPLSDDGMIKYSRVRIGLPDIDLLTQYREMKDKSIDNFMQSYIEEFEISSGIRSSVCKPSRADIIEEKGRLAWDDYMNLNHDYISISHAATKHGLDPKTFKKWIYRNGHLPEEREKPSV